METKDLAGLIAAIAIAGLTFSAGIKGCTAYNLKQLENQQKAVEAGCSVVGYNIVCPQR